MSAQPQMYRYKGFDAKGNKLDGEVSASSMDEAERRLSAQGVIPVTIVLGGASERKKPAHGSSGGGSLRLFGPRRVSDADVATVLRDMAVMAETGVPLLEALDAIIASSRSVTIVSALRDVREAVVGGKGISDAMRQGNMFPTVVCEMVKVAEEGGSLDIALANAASYMERAAELRRKVVNSMLYPGVMVAISTITVLVLIVFVMPRFSGIFSKMNAELPAVTKLMLTSGEFIRAKPLLSLLIAAGALVGLRFTLRLDPVRAMLNALFLRTPILGDLLRKLAFSRAFRSIATLLGSNVSLLSALEHGAAVSGNSKVKGALLKARSSVEHGSSLSDALAETGVFPPMLVQMVAVGERTGRLSPLMASTASRMEDDVDARLKALVAVIEPVMIVVMGAIVGVITLSIITPIYSVVQNIK